MKKKKYYMMIAGACVILAGVLFLLGRSEKALGTGGVLVVQSTAKNENAPVKGANESPQSTIAVHVCGAVAKEGVYKLEAGSRIEDAVNAAGGFLKSADRDYLNLAKQLADGEQIRVPTVQEAVSLKEEEDRKSDGKININTATEEELATLPGIGSAKASAIIAWRTENGGFENIEDIMKVSGIKESAFSRFRDRIKTGD